MSGSETTSYRPKTEDELIGVIRETLTFEQPSSQTAEEIAQKIAEGTFEMSQSYSTSADALWKVALASFNYACHEVGATEFQASWAELRFLSESRGLKGPFALIDGHDMLYPQYDIAKKVEGYLEEWRPWAADQARKELSLDRPVPPSPRVEERWVELAASCPPQCPHEGCEVTGNHGHGTDATYRPKEN